jgi:alkylhydroperoxidase family enzyme
MPRIQGIDSATAEGQIKAAFEAQTKKWGAPLGPHLIYARRPSIFRGVTGMWAAVDACRRLDPALRALVNRRVAALNGCEFWQDINAAVSSELGVTTEKILALGEYATSPLYSEAERVALEYADAITLSDRDVSDDLFGRLRTHYDDDAIVELTEVIAWENASSKFNRALRIPSQGLWKRSWAMCVQRVGGALSRLALAAFLRGARETKDKGGFAWVRDTVPSKELKAIFPASTERVFRPAGCRGRPAGQVS